MSTGLKECRIGKTVLAGHGLRSRRHTHRRHVPGDGDGNRGRHSARGCRRRNRYFDTTLVCRFGLCEIRHGKSIATLPREKIAISPKVGYSLVPIDPGELKPGLRDQRSPMRTNFEYSHDAVLRSIEPSLKRLDTP